MALTRRERHCKRGTLGSSEHRNTAKNIVQHRVTARKVDGTPSPQYIVLVWWYKDPRMIILFKIIYFYLRKNSKINTSQVENRGYSTDSFGSRSFRLNFATGSRYKNVGEVICCFLLLNYGNGNTEDNFFPPNTVDFKMQTSHTVRLEKLGFFFTATQHKKLCNTANLHCPPPARVK